jgi:hypothetical protein
VEPTAKGRWINVASTSVHRLHDMHLVAAIQSLFGIDRQTLVTEITYGSASDCTQCVLVQGLCIAALQGRAYSGRTRRAGLRVGSYRINTCSNSQVLSLAYRRGRGFGGLKHHPPEISKF